MRTPISLLLILWSCAALGQTFTSSNLPIIHLSTGSATIVDEPKVVINMGIIDNLTGVNSVTDSWNGYDGKVGGRIYW